MVNVRCQCGKILCQVANQPELPVAVEAAPGLKAPAIVILCRHCKRHMLLNVPKVTAVGFASGPQPCWADGPLVASAH